MNPLRNALLLLTLPVAALACHRSGNDPARAGQPQTQTIAPAAAQPAPQTDTGEMTQTVDIEDSRSEAEGAGANVAPPKAPATKKAPAASKKKH